jgi:hypothetical protein
MRQPKPCPLCQRKVFVDILRSGQKYTSDTPLNRYRIECKICDLRLTKNDREAAVRTWNQRAPVEQTAEVVA